MRSVAGFVGLKGQMLDVVGDRTGEGQEVGGGGVVEGLAGPGGPLAEVGLHLGAAESGPG